MAITVGAVQVEVLPDARRFNTSLKAQLKALPAATVNVEANTAKALKQIETLTKTRTAKVNVEIGGLADQRAKLEALARNRSTRLDLDLDTRGLQRKIAAAEAKATITVEANTSIAERQIAALLKDRRIIIRAEVDTRAAETKLVDLVRRRSAQVTAEANTAVASEQLRVAARDRTVNVAIRTNTSSLDAARTGINGLVVAALALGPAIVPLAGAAVAGIGAIGIAATAAAGGVGVLALAFHGVGDALTATGKAQASAAAEAQQASATQLAAARSLESAQRAARSATTALPTAIRDAALSVAGALRSQELAERSVVSAQRDALNAQEALTNARQAAKRTLEDLQAATKQGALDERSASIAIQQARERLNAALADPESSQLDISAAQVGYDQAKASLDEIQRRNARLHQDKKKADRDGVDGADSVQAATQRVADTQTAVLDAQRNLTDSNAALTRARVDGAQSVADAEERVSVAQQAVADAQGAVTTAALTMGAAAVAADAAMANLSPAGREFVGFIQSVKPQFAALQTLAATGLLPGVQAGIAALLPILPAVGSLISSLATAMGDLFTRAGQALASPFWQDFFAFLQTTAGPALTILATAIGNLIEGFVSLLIAFQPVADQVLAGLVNLTAGFATWAAGLGTNQGFQDFLAYIRDVGPLVVATLGSLWDATVNLLAGLAPLGKVVLVIVGQFANLIAATPTPVLTLILAIVLPLVVGIYAISTATRVWANAVLAWNTVSGAYVKAQQAYALWTYSSSAANVRAAATSVAYRAGLIVGTAMLWAATAAQWAWNIAITANPIGLIILAIAALVVAIVLIVKHWDVFKAGFQVAWDAIKAGFAWLRDNWPLVLAILTGPIGIAIYEIHKHFDDIVAFITGLPARIGAAAVGMWDGIVNAFRAAINVIIAGWNALDFSVPSVDTHIPGVGTIGGFTLGLPDIPLLALGGVATSPTLAMIGESGPEAVVPLDDQRALANILGAAQKGNVAGATGTGGGVHLEQHIHNPIPERASESSITGLRRATLALGL